VIRDIVQVPAAMLRQPSKPVFDIDQAMKRLLNDLLDTMRAHHALGLSAVQIGMPLRVIGVSPRSGCPWMVMVNPEIVSRSGAILAEDEGCMSIGMGKPRFRVKRSQTIKVGFLSRDGAEVETTLDGLAARVVQHEIDHLDGVLIDEPRKDRGNKWSSTSSAAAS
jgi:peptide deformylase